MSETVNLPALGESVTEGTVTRWLKQVGDEVAVDEALVEVSTDKVDTEVPSPVAGVVEKILVDEDEDVEVGAPLVVIGDGSGGSDQDSDSGADTAEESASQDSADDSGDSSEEAQEAPKADTKQASGNSVEVTLPALGESVTEGTVTRWLKQVGESIEVDEPLLEVSTDKVDTEVPSPVAGTILEIKVQEDEDAEVGQVLAIVGDESAAGSGDSGSDNGSSEQSGETKAEKVEDAATTADSGEDTEQAAEAKTEQAPKADTKQASGNSVEVTLPALGESVTEGTVTRWL
ncbi:biotin/lipoyl-containing protein, partial [Kocuria rhizophila]